MVGFLLNGVSYVTRAMMFIKIMLSLQNLRGLQKQHYDEVFWLVTTVEARLLP